MIGVDLKKAHGVAVRDVHVTDETLLAFSAFYRELKQFFVASDFGVDEYDVRPYRADFQVRKERETVPVSIVLSRAVTSDSYSVDVILQKQGIFLGRKAEEGSSSAYKSFPLGHRTARNVALFVADCAKHCNVNPYLAFGIVEHPEIKLENLRIYGLKM